ncbi:MAG: pinensin family lanthipeptide [Cyclobacteriaceae bacterium]
MKKKKIKLKDLEVKSFLIEIPSDSNQTADVKGGWTGNCGSFINVTCPDPNCDFQSIPVNECFPTDKCVDPSSPINFCDPPRDVIV